MNKLDDDSILPKVERVIFIIEDSKLFVAFEGERREVAKAFIISNGLRDLCFCLDESGNPTVRETAKVESDRILYKPLHDIWWLQLREPMGNKNAVIFEIDDRLKKTVDEVVRIFGGTKGPDYDMCGGTNYGGLYLGH